jgi:transcriptional regulator with XRE-family HTH domain
VREQKRRRLEAKGWKVGTAQECLQLTVEEAAYVELKAQLAMGLREWRRRGNITQAELARRLRSSQSRIAKMEAGDPSVSIDLLIRSLLTLGASRRELSRMISARSRVPAATLSGRVRAPRAAGPLERDVGRHHIIR